MMTRANPLIPIWAKPVTQIWWRKVCHHLPIQGRRAARVNLQKKQDGSARSWKRQKRSNSTLKQNHHQSHHHAPHYGDVKPVLEHHSVHSAMGKAPASWYLKSDWCCSLQPSTWHALLWYFCSDALWAVPPSEKAVVHPAELIREKSGFDRPPFQSRHMSCLTAPACVSMRKE